MTTSNIITILIIFLIIVAVGFIVGSIKFSNCSTPDIPTTPAHCPNFCECGYDAVACQIPECDYLKCHLQWYGICLI